MHHSKDTSDGKLEEIGEKEEFLPMPRHSKDTSDGELEEIVEKEEFLSIFKKKCKFAIKDFYFSSEKEIKDHPLDPNEICYHKKL